MKKIISIFMVFTFVVALIVVYNTNIANSAEKKYSDIEKVVKNNCASCHKGSRSFDSYDKLMKYVKAGKSADSKLYTHIIKDKKHSDRIKSDVKSDIKAWIDSGARK